MGKMKEVFAQHQQEQNDFETYYHEMYKIAQYMGTEKIFHELYTATSQTKTNNQTKKQTNDRKTK